MNMSDENNVKNNIEKYTVHNQITHHQATRETQRLIFEGQSEHNW